MSKRTKKANRLVKRLAHEVADEETSLMPYKRARSGYDILSQMFGEHLHALTPGQLQHFKSLLKKKYSRGVDINYLKTIMFPEYFNSDVPQPLTNLAYCRFTDKQDVVLNTGPKGGGLVLWFPRTTQGPSLFYMADQETVQGQAGSIANMPSTTPIPFDNRSVNTGQGTSTQPCFDNSVWWYGMWKGYSNCFTQTSLVAASLSMQYIGQSEQECGIWVGGHIYGLSPSNLLLEDIEQSQYVTKRRPSDGLRFTYLPMEMTDYEYYPTSKTSSKNAGAAPVGADKACYFLTTPVSADAGTKVARSAATFSSLSGPTSIVPSAAGYAAGDGIMFSSATNYVAIYWKGLQPNSDWIRFDSVRKFNGVPQQQYRDVVEVARSKKTYDSKKTFDVLKQLCINTPVGGHSLREVEQQMDRIVTNLPNAVQLLDSGEPMQSQSLEELANALERQM